LQFTHTFVSGHPQIEVEIGELSSQRVGKGEKCNDRSPGKIKRKLVKAVTFLAAVNDEEQNGGCLSS